MIVGVARTLPQSGPPSELRPIVYAPLQAEPAPDGRAAIIAQRTEEIGVRMALGAGGRDVVRMFVRRTMRQLALAIALGLAGSLAVGNLIGSFVQGVGRRDLVPLMVVTVVLGSITLLATLLPARRAARVDPVVAMRYE
jgi:putative ABC transport system permease protein